MTRRTLRRLLSTSALTPPEYAIAPPCDFRLIADGKTPDRMALTGVAYA